MTARDRTTLLLQLGRLVKQYTQDDMNLVSVTIGDAAARDLVHTAQEFYQAALKANDLAIEHDLHRELVAVSTR